MTPLPFFNLQTMKKFIYVFLGATLSLGMLSCSSGKKKEMTIAEQYLRPASMNYSGKDSSEIKTLVENYVSALKSKNIEAAANMLYFVRNDSIFPITEKDRKGFTALYNSMPILDCKATTLILRSELNNEARIVVTLKEDGDIDRQIGTTTISLNPVLIEGKWYLTLLDKSAQGVEDVYEKE